jgi:hypothetical protein
VPAHFCSFPEEHATSAGVSCIVANIKVAHANIDIPHSVFRLSLFQPAAGRNMGRSTRRGCAGQCCYDNNPTPNKRTAAGTFALQHQHIVERHLYRILGAHSSRRWQKTDCFSRRIQRYPEIPHFAFPSLRVFSQHNHRRTSCHGPIHNTRRYTLRAPACIRRRRRHVAADARRVNNALVDKRGREPELHAVSIFPRFHSCTLVIPTILISLPTAEDPLSKSRLQPCRARTAPQQRWANA